MSSSRKLLKDKNDIHKEIESIIDNTDVRKKLHDKLNSVFGGGGAIDQLKQQRKEYWRRKKLKSN